MPRPIEITFDETSSSRDKLCKEVLNLTRINWNSAAYNCLLPITLYYAKRVGRILREMPPGVTPEPRYRYYM